MKKVIKNYIYFFIALLMLLSLSSCASSPYLKDLKDPMDDKLSLVIGYIDMEESPAKLQWVRIKQLQPETDRPYFGFLIAEDMFYIPYIKLGIFKFHEFGGASKSYFIDRTNYTFSFPAQGKGEWDPVIQIPGIYFVGSYKFKKIETGFFEQGKFDLVKINNPTEKEVLKKILKYAEKTKWEQKILKRLDELK